MAEEMSLVKLPTGSAAKIIRFDGGAGLASKLSDMGVSPGKTLKKISGIPMGGPVTVKVGSSTISIGHGEAKKIIVTPEGK